jgi:hypothetical protein
VLDTDPSIMNDGSYREMYSFRWIIWIKLENTILRISYSVSLPNEAEQVLTTRQSHSVDERPPWARLYSNKFFGHQISRKSLGNLLRRELTQLHNLKSVQARTYDRTLSEGDYRYSTVLTQ